MQRAHVAHAGIDDEGTRALGLEAGGQQIAEVAVGALAGHRRDDDVAGPDLLGRDMQHPVVARLQQHRHRRARYLCTLEDRPHIGFEQADAAHGLMHRGGAEMRQRVGRDAIGALDVAIHHTQFVHFQLRFRFSLPLWRRVGVGASTWRFAPQAPIPAFPQKGEGVLTHKPRAFSRASRRVNTRRALPS